MTNGTLIGLDIGSRRIGVSIARGDVHIARPLQTLENTKDVFTEIVQLLGSNDVAQIVAGLPRGLDGQTTAQTESVEAFIAELRKHTTVAIAFQDEALTSIKAETELANRKKVFSKGDVDALAATYILEDYLSEQGGQYA